MSKISFLRLGMGLCAAASLFGLCPAHAVPIITPIPPTVTVVEGIAGSITFHVRNDLFFNSIQISSVTAGPITFLSGDGFDMVVTTTIGTDLCTGAVLAPKGTCIFVQNFTTQDLFPQFSDHNVGVWDIANSIVSDIVNMPPPHPRTDHGHATVRVKDVSEPGSLYLLGIGAFAAVGTGRIWRHLRT